MTLVLAVMHQPMTPPTTEPIGDPTTFRGAGVLSGIGSVVSGLIENLGRNGYQTGVALIVATTAIVLMLNMNVHKLVIAPVAIGAFWAGWLGWNTLSGQNNPLFPGAEATKLWDVALAGDRGFLIVVIVACLAGFFVWRSSIKFASRLWLLFGAVLGASFLYNFFQAVRVA
jgi:hypothetical protein